MNILFLSQKNLELDSENLYVDLLNTLISVGHSITMVCADNVYERTCLVNYTDYKKLQIKISNQFGVNIIKKGMVLLSLEYKMRSAIKKYLKMEKFDLVLYATPPITLNSVIKFCKNYYGCTTYLMLKDIFPQNAVDMGMMSKNGLMSIIYKYFRKKEISLYKNSDKIGCMSKANMDYLLQHNGIDRQKVELFPNSIIINQKTVNADKSVLKKLGVDTEKLVFIYGGNLGKPQGLEFLAKGIKSCVDILDVHFIIVGKGSEQKRLFKDLENYKNVTTIDFLPNRDYLKLCSECDIGMVMLDKRFTIPNYPSRILSYMENTMPIFACTDKATDIKELVEVQANCGKWCYSDNVSDFVSTINWFVENKAKLSDLGQNGRDYLEKNFDVSKHIYKIERTVKKGE